LPYNNYFKLYSIEEPHHLDAALAPAHISLAFNLLLILRLQLKQEQRYGPGLVTCHFVAGVLV
jgi:hypothetical protein